MDTHGHQTPGPEHATPSYTQPAAPSYAPPSYTPPSHYQRPNHYSGQVLTGVPPVTMHGYGTPPPVAVSTFGTGIKVTIGIVSFLKALPLVLLMFIGMAWSNELDEEFDGLVALVALVVFGLLAVLGAQTYAIMANKKTLFMIFGGLICLIDALVLLGSLNNIEGLGLVAVVIAAQFASYVGAARTKI